MKKYLYLLFTIATVLVAIPTYAAPCSSYPLHHSNIVLSAGRIVSLDINTTHGYDVDNQTICPNGFGTTQGNVLLNNIPAEITSWTMGSISINVPSSIEGLADIKVIDNDGAVYNNNENQLLISLKIDSHPSQITLGDSIEIVGNFANTAGAGDNINNINSWPGRVVNLSTSDFTPLFLESWTDSKIIFPTNFTNFKVGSNTLKIFYGSNNPNNGYQSKPFGINIIAPLCTVDAWKCSEWNTCSAEGNQTRTCSKKYTCEGGEPSPETSQSCTPPCTSDTWSCGGWSACSIYRSQTRTCNKTFDCSSVNTPSPPISQNCTPPEPEHPSCTADTWACEAWGSCSLSGIQSRNCNKTLDCPDVQTASPITDQYCEPPSRPAPQTPPSGTDEILNQDSIIKSTVKLLCPVNAQMASQGSGTVIDSGGTILTNKHVIVGTLGCFVGFIDNFNDEPYFGERQIADIFKISPNQDIAILKIRNPQNKQLTSIDITKGNSNLRLGTKITIYGYPAKFGTNITYTSGDFSGIDGSYLKTTAILEYGNSGGGAYLKDGTFIGIPSAVVRGELNALGYILSINTINAWLGNSNIISSGTSNNNYSRVSVLEDMDLKKLGSLKLFIPDTDAKGNLTNPSTATNQTTTNQKSQEVQTQQESIVIEPSKNSVENSNPAPQASEQKLKVSWFKNFIQWITNLFKR